MTVPAIAIAIPAHDEAALIGRCLDALARQQGGGSFTVTVLADRCEDDTAAIARRPRGIDVRVIEHRDASRARGAGHARRRAMQEAGKLGDIILTTDADCMPDADWVVSHRQAFAAGVDAVAGRVSGDWDELRHHPADTLRIGALEWEYLGLIGEAEALFDPRPHDPAPRHAQRCGANIGITRSMLDRVGGVPALATGEDRALLAAVERLDGTVRHDPRPHVVASARVAGRATGGMADALAARASNAYRCDDQFAPAELLVARWRARHAARLAWADGARSGRGGRAGAASEQAMPTFGAAFEQVEQKISVRLSPDELPAQIDRMRQLIAQHG